MSRYGLNVYASDFVIDEENIWFVPFGYNYLCCYNLKQNRMEKRILLPVKNNSSTLYGSILKTESRIVLIPFKAEAAIVYDMDDGKLTKFLADGNRREEIYRACCMAGGKVWMIPWIRRDNDIQEVFIKKIRLHDGKIEFLEAFHKNTQPKDKGERWLFNGNCVSIENSVYIGYRNCIIEINIINGCRKTYIVGDDKTIYTTMCMLDEERLCMIDVYGSVVIWNRKSEKPVMKIKNESICLKMQGFSNGHGHREGYGSSVVYHNEYVWFIPSHADKVLQLDIKNEMLSEAWFSSDICGNVMERPDCCGQFSKAHIIGEYLYVWNLWNECLFIIDIMNHRIERRYMEIGISPDEFCSMLWECLEEHEGICHEEILGTEGLNLFINSLCSDICDRRTIFENSDKSEKKEQAAGKCEKM